MGVRPYTRGCSAVPLSFAHTHKHQRPKETQCKLNTAATQSTSRYNTSYIQLQWHVSVPEHPIDPVHQQLRRDFLKQHV